MAWHHRARYGLQPR